ncbi:hypothetical protein [Aciditerrimonas ferrireducens]|uniref:hypothetical protein n=1 Tax=Aciditerrimonas ferrireducens TaxID=667306 RepID=UPI00200674D5|nr:hypothetical protein [Aciditerrimonas ferrireducens]MCK4177419.1 hypothetical protein [Aciditerrimonas ferrireducens]
MSTTDWLSGLGSAVAAAAAVVGVVRGSQRREEPKSEPGDRPSAPVGPSAAPFRATAPSLETTPARPPTAASRKDVPVAEELWKRVLQKGKEIDLAELGTRVGAPERGRRQGALVVRLHYGGSFSDPGRPKFGPGHIDPTTILDNTVKYWQIGGLIEYWREHPEEIPDRLIGLAGPVRQRFVVSSLPIDTERLFDRWEANRGEVAVVEAADGSVDLDYLGLRFCQVKDARFGNLPQCFFIWVDRDGQERAGGREGKSLT